MLKDIAEKDVTYCSNRRQYWALLTSGYFAIHRYRGGGGDYELHFRRIRDSINRVQAYLKQLLGPGSTPSSPLTHLDYVTLFHMIEVSKNQQYAELPISDLYASKRA